MNHKILSIETILSTHMHKHMHTHTCTHTRARAHTHTHTHTGTCTNKHTDYIKFNFHNNLHNLHINIRAAETHMPSHPTQLVKSPEASQDHLGTKPHPTPHLGKS